LNDNRDASVAKINGKSRSALLADLLFFCAAYAPWGAVRLLAFEKIMAPVLRILRFLAEFSAFLTRGCCAVACF